MIPSLIVLTLIVAIVAKIVYDVQKVKQEKLDRAYLQVLAGIEVDEELAEQLRARKMKAKEKRKYKPSKAKKETYEQPVSNVEETLAKMSKILMTLEERNKLSKKNPLPNDTFEKLLKEQEKNAEAIK